MGEASATARPLPLWRFAAARGSSPIDQCSDIAPRTISTLTTLNLAPSSVLAWPRGLSPSLDVQVSHKIADDLYLLDIVVSDFHAGELVLNRQHQLDPIE